LNRRFAIIFAFVDCHRALTTNALRGLTPRGGGGQNKGMNAAKPTSTAPGVPASPSIPRPRQMPLPIIAWLIGINLLWGGSSLAAKIALGSPQHPGLPPMTLAFVRFSLAALAMYAVAKLLKVDMAVARRDWPRFWMMGVVGLAVTYLLSYLGIARTSVSDASLIIATEPVFLAILAFFFLREPMRPAKVGGITAGLAGVYLIVNNGFLPRPFSGMVAGDLLIALGLTFEASSSILGKGLVARYPAISVITYQMMSGAIALAPFSLWEMLHAQASDPLSMLIRPSTLLSLLYLIVPCTVLAYTAWFSILDKHEAGEMSVFLFLQPIVGTALGAYFFHDAVTRFTIIGAVLVLSGIALINRRPPLPTSPSLPPSA